MTIDKERKKHLSDICIDGKRITAMKEIAMAAFGESFMFIEIHPSRIFIIHVNDGIGNGIDIDRLVKFQEKYRLCRVKVYDEKDLFPLKNTKSK